jgi:tetratricopeptide (TPR) repeat protein
MRQIAISLFFLVLLGAGTAAQEGNDFPSLDPDPAAEAHARRGGRTWEDLAETGLWASGGDAEERAALMGRLGEAVEELRNGPDLPRSPRERGEFILTWMHERFLRSYSLPQTRLDLLLTGGRYNCVSSAVLYLVLGNAVGLEIRGVMTRDHAFAALRAGDEWIDVETTNPYGFDPGKRREFHDQFGKLTGFAYVPARNYRDRADISPLELISLILSNRIAELERQNRFAEAVPLAINRAALLPGGPPAGDAAEPAPFFEDPRRDLMNRLFNFGAFLLGNGREEEALRWAALAGARYPDEKRWQEFIFAAAHNRMVKQVRGGRLAEARESLNLLAPVLSAANFDRLDMVLIDTELVDAASRIGSAGEAGAVIAAIDRAAGRKLLPHQRGGELRVFAVEKAAAVFSAAGDWPGAIAWLEDALERHGPSRRLERSLSNARSNLATDYHNRFAAAWNRRDREEAERILAEGLALFPRNRQLLSDKAAVERTAR